MREIGQVIKCDGNIAKVRVIKHSACNKCDRDCLLLNSETDEQERMIFEVKNNIKVNQGDQVSIELEDKNIFFSSLIIYIMPVINMIIGYFFGQWLKIKYNILILTFEISGIFGSILFLFLSYLLLKYINSKLENTNKINPKIVKIHNYSRYNN